MVGWRMSATDPERLVLDSDGRLMAGRMVFVRAGTDITWTTMLRFHRPVGRHIWSVAGRAHRELAPRCLDRARHYFTRHSAPSSDEASRD